jgi:hypothetical protein
VAGAAAGRRAKDLGHLSAETSVAYPTKNLARKFDAASYENAELL